MRGGRSLLILLIVALGLGAYIYFVESERDPTGTETKDQLFAIEPADVTEIEIRAAETAVVRRTGDAWALVAPVAAPADAAALDSIVSSLAAVEIDRVLEETPGDLAPFGLDAPRLTVTFKTIAGAEHQLLLGSTTPTGSGMYARTADSPRLLLIPAYLEWTFNKTPFDLRDRRALAIDRNTVDRVTLAPRGAATIDLRRDDSDWRLAAPLEARADFSAADSILGRLTTTQMSAIVVEGTDLTPAQLRTYGLDAPQIVATLGAGSTTATLAIGNARNDATVYARDLARPMVFTVDASLLTDLKKEPADLRVKDVFELNAFSAQSIELVHGALNVAYAKAAPEGGDASAMPVWSRTRPETGEVNQTALTDLLNTLSSLRAERFVSQAPASDEDVAVTARYGSSDAPNEERVTLRKSGQTAYALRAGERDAAVISPAEFDTVVSQLKTLTGGE